MLDRAVLQLFLQHCFQAIPQPARLLHLAALAFITDSEGYIGRGVATELDTMLDKGKPCYYLAPTGDLLLPDQWMLSDPDRDNWRQYQRLTITGREPSHPLVEEVWKRISAA